MPILPLAKPIRSGHRSRGFTLIEVLVVVAIIALLLAILLPSLKKAREQTRITVCLTNLHDTGAAAHAYSVTYDPYYPLIPYMGSTIYYDRPGADDNLFILWYSKLCPNVATFTCPATNHRIRKPVRIDKVKVAKGLKFNIYCDPNSKETRNDWEMHGQLVKEFIQDPSAREVPVNGFGTSYEYAGWMPGSTDSQTTVNWYPFKRQVTVGGEPATVRNVKFPATYMMMKDADEGSSMGDVVGAPPGAARNNIPDPWDNHGALLCNFLYFDGHVKSSWYNQQLGRFVN